MLVQQMLGQKTEVESSWSEQGRLQKTCPCWEQLRSLQQAACLAGRVGSCCCITMVLAGRMDSLVVVGSLVYQNSEGRADVTVSIGSRTRKVLDRIYLCIQRKV